jgi:hypothetical protein
MCDTNQEGFLSHKGLQVFQRLNGHFASDEEIIAIVRRLDADASQRISYQEFSDGLRPIYGHIPKPQLERPLPSVIRRSQSPFRMSHSGSIRKVRFEDGGIVGRAEAVLDRARTANQVSRRIV